MCAGDLSSATLWPCVSSPPPSRGCIAETHTSRCAQSKRNHTHTARGMVCTEFSKLNGRAAHWYTPAGHAAAWWPQWSLSFPLQGRARSLRKRRKSTSGCRGSSEMPLPAASQAAAVTPRAHREQSGRCPQRAVAGLTPGDRAAQLRAVGSSRSGRQRCSLLQTARTLLRTSTHHARQPRAVAWPSPRSWRRPVLQSEARPPLPTAVRVRMQYAAACSAASL